MNDFVKTIKLNFVVDDKVKSTVDDLKKTVDETFTSSFDKNFKTEFRKWAKDLEDAFSFDDADPLKELNEELSQQLQEQLKAQEEIAEIKRQISELEKLGTDTAKVRIKLLEEELEKREAILDADKQANENISTVDVDNTKKKGFKDDFKSGFKNTFKDMFKIDGKGLNGEAFGNAAAKAMKKVLDKAWAALKKIFKDAWSELKNIVNFSRLSNEDTRELAFTYGFDSSQAYGWTKAMGALGFNSEEDLWWATTQERQLFFDAFNKYADKYNQLYDSGTFEQMIEYQVEMAEFEEDIKLELVQFFMDNKDTLKWGLQALLDISQFVLEIVGFVRKYFGSGGGSERSSSERASALSQVLNNYSTNKNVSVKVDNTYNNVSSENRGWLQKAGEQTYEQIVAYLEE